MNVEIIDRAACKDRARETLNTAQVNPQLFTALYLGLTMVLSLIAQLVTPDDGIASLLSNFATILASLTSSVLAAGFVLYCMAIRRGERAEYLTLFDGFSMVGKLIGLQIVITCFIVLWSMLFIIPGIIAMYRYQFALFNLLENPNLGIMDALNMSKRQTLGYKGQLFMLDLSYIGWNLLSTLPITVYLTYVSAQLVQAVAANVTPDVIIGTMLTLETRFVVVFVFTAVWALVVGLFYIPNYQCVQLAYFDAAKRTSGINPLPITAHDPSAFNPPNNQGSL